MAKVTKKELEEKYSKMSTENGILKRERNKLAADLRLEKELVQQYEDTTRIYDRALIAIAAVIKESERTGTHENAILELCEYRHVRTPFDKACLSVFQRQIQIINNIFEKADFHG